MTQSSQELSLHGSRCDSVAGVVDGEFTFQAVDSQVDAGDGAVPGAVQEVLHALPIGDLGAAGAREVKAGTATHTGAAPVQEAYLVPGTVVQEHEQACAVLKPKMAISILCMNIQTVGAQQVQDGSKDVFVGFRQPGEG